MCPTKPRAGRVARGAKDQDSSLLTVLPTEEIEKKLNTYHKGARIWKMLIFCQVGLVQRWAKVGPGQTGHPL